MASVFQSERNAVPKISAAIVAEPTIRDSRVHSPSRTSRPTTASRKTRPSAKGAGWFRFGIGTGPPCFL